MLKFIFRFIGFLILAGALVFGGIALFNAGWSQGLLSATAQTAPAAPAAPQTLPYAYGYGMHARGFVPGMMGMGFGLGLIHLFLLVLLVGLGLRLIFGHHHMWRGYGAGNFGPCNHFGHFHHHMGPPDPEHYAKWYQEWEQTHPADENAGTKTDDTAKS